MWGAAQLWLPVLTSAPLYSDFIIQLDCWSYTMNLQKRLLNKLEVSLTYNSSLHIYLSHNTDKLYCLYTYYV